MSFAGFNHVFLMFSLTKLPFQICFHDKNTLRCPNHQHLLFHSQQTIPSHSSCSSMAALAELEKVQTRILQRISDLEISHLPQDFSNLLSLSTTTDGSSEISTTESRLSAILRSNSVADFSFKRVPSDYYDLTLEDRRDILGAASIHHLCKTIVLVNTQAPSDVTDCSNRNYSKYYCVIVQYSARFNAETVKNFLYTLNDGKISKKKFNMRLAPEDISCQLTGYGHNAVTCIGMATDIPVILDEAIVKLSPDYFWLGGGEVDLKLGIKTSKFVDFVKPFLVSVSSG